MGGHLRCGSLSPEMLNGDPGSSSVRKRMIYATETRPKAGEIMASEHSPGYEQLNESGHRSRRFGGTRTVQLEDDVIHPASAFQVAGFGHVMASMWASHDEICVDMAQGF